MGNILKWIFNLIRNILAVIGLITVIVVVVIGVFIWSFTRPSHIESTMHNVEITDAAAYSFDTKWEEFTSGIPGVENTLRLTEAEISSKAQAAASELGLPINIDKVLVNFEPGSVHVSIAIIGGMFGINFHISAAGKVDIEEKQDGTKVLKYYIEDYNVPSQLMNIVEKNVGDRLNVDEALEKEIWHEWELPEDWDIDLTSINIEEVAGQYQLVIVGALQG